MKTNPRYYEINILTSEGDWVFTLEEKKKMEAVEIKKKWEADGYIVQVEEFNPPEFEPERIAY